MADIKQYTDEIQNAIYGEEVRGSIINALNKVNDDNDSYQDLKKQVVNAQTDVNNQVQTFEQKVATAKSATTALETAITNAGTAKKNLESATSTANTARTNLSNTTSSANTTKTNLDKSISTANSAISSASTAKTNLDGSISSAQSALSNLNKAITNAGSAKSNLESSTSTANTARQNLSSIIDSASSAKTQLQSVIDSATTARANLSSTVSTAQTLYDNLLTLKGTSETVYNNLVNQNKVADSNITEIKKQLGEADTLINGMTTIMGYLDAYVDSADILGIQVDYQNKTCKRLSGAYGLSAGADFDKFGMYGGRKKCNVSDNGTIVAWQGASDYKEDGSMGQVMVYQPKFYYKVIPLKYEKNNTGYGFHLRKANYYITENETVGFKLHPAFYDKNGKEVDYILMGAYEGSLWDASANKYILDESQVMDANADKFSSIAGARPASGLSQNLNKVNIEKMCQNRGANWHLENIKITSMNQLLMIVELGMMNTQTAIAQGVVSISDNGSYSCASYTGSTASLGNGTGRASTTKDYTGANQTADGKTSIVYRGLENPWGNIWKHIQGINIWGNGAMAGGQPYICKDFSYDESKNSGNYEGAGFTVTGSNGYISAMGYSTSCDWLFLPSECAGNASVPVGDYTWITANLNGYRIALLGGRWDYGSFAGGFCWTLNSGVGVRARGIGGRLVYVPTA